MSQYRGRHRAGGRHRARRQHLLLQQPMVPAAAIATVAVAAASAAAISGESPASASAAAYVNTGQLNLASVQDRAAEQQASRSNVRSAAAVAAQAKAAEDARVKARSAALAKAKTAKELAQKKAALSALAISVTAAADPTKTSTSATAPATSSTATASSKARSTAGSNSSATDTQSTSSGWTCAIAGCGGAFTSGFGYRSQFGAMHLGDDFSVSVGTPLHSLHQGTIVAAGPYGGMGNRVEIDFGNGVSSIYAHMSSITASVGQRVSAGQVIGYSGNTGHSTGPHLHLEIHVNGTPVNPQPWLREHGIF